MLPPRRNPTTAVAAPLLTFPPSPPPPRSLPPIDHHHHHRHDSSLLSSLSSELVEVNTSQKSRKRRKRQSLCYRVLTRIPLGFIASLLLFAMYSVGYSLCYDYLIKSKRDVSRGIGVFAGFGWSWFGCGMSLWQCFVKREDNFVVIEEEEIDGLEDEESEIRGRGGLGDSRRLVEEEDEQEEDEEQVLEVGQDTNEERSLLIREGGGRGRKSIEVKADGTKRFCRKCNVLKPDRAHHCSTCQRCVLKMDHHCPWLGGGCAGYANYKFFIQFLLYTGVLGVYTSIVCFYYLVHYTSNEPSGFEMAPISWALAALLGIIFGSATGLFGLYHLYLAATNRTTIEAMESPTTFSTTLPPRHLIEMFRVNRQLQQHQQQQQAHTQRPLDLPVSSRNELIRQLNSRLNPKQKNRLNKAKRKFNVYDLGWRGNLREVFLKNGDEVGRRRRRMGNRASDGGLGRVGGEREEERLEENSWWEWIVPWGSPARDGHSFPINYENLRKLEQVSKEVWAEVEAEERERSARRGVARWEGGLSREGGFEGEETETEPSNSEDDDRPLRAM